MNSKIRKVFSIIIACAALLLLIFDAETALIGAQEGVRLSLQTVAPTLFPFLFLTGLIQPVMLGRKIPLLSAIAKACGIPKGAEALLLIGLTGGYPVGGRAVAEAYCAGQLDRLTAKRMLGFCNNAGPAFIFGMLSTVFISPAAPVLLWLIHILSACLTGILLPGKSPQGLSRTPTAPPEQLPHTLRKSINTVVMICGWVVLFRILIAFCEKWATGYLGAIGTALLCGILELSNGCVSLGAVSNQGVTLLLAAVMLSFGGVCIILQTAGVTRKLGLGMYLPGKIMQTAFSYLLVLPFALYRNYENSYLIYTLALIGALISILAIIFTYIFCKKRLEFCRRIVYNTEKK